jgi:hypothetical protein
MRTLLALCLAMVPGLLSLAAGAQTVGEEAKACVPGSQPINPDYRRDSEAEWPMEAQRFKKHEELVSRREDRLRLALDGGRTLELVDCPYGESGYRYLFERYDQAGRLYVVRKIMPDDLSYALVMMATGRLFTVHGMPVWPAERSRFLSVACSLQPPRGTLSIQAPAGEGLTTEAEFPLPCDSESCSARWDHQTWISVTCSPREPGSKKGAEFVLIRGNDNKWNKFGR